MHWSYIRNILYKCIQDICLFRHVRQIIQHWILYFVHIQSMNDPMPYCFLKAWVFKFRSRLILRFTWMMLWCQPLVYGLLLILSDYWGGYPVMVPRWAVGWRSSGRLVASCQVRKPSWQQQRLACAWPEERRSSHGWVLGPEHVFRCKTKIVNIRINNKCFLRNKLTK